MDSLVAAAARALSAGDALGALKRIALRDDPSALALRGIAMAQLGEFPRARELLRRAARGFGSHERSARARCLVAEAEVALALRDFANLPRSLVAATAHLDAAGERTNAMQARLVLVRRLLLLGRLAEADDALRRLNLRGLPPALLAIAALIEAELALRSLQAASGRAALVRAESAARRAQVPALLAEVEEAQRQLERPVACRKGAEGEEALGLDAVAALARSSMLLVDGCRRTVGVGTEVRSMTGRPILFALVRALGQAWPGDVARDTLITGSLGARRPNESHRARLRVEVSRLRKAMAGLARIVATPRGFSLVPLAGHDVVVLAPPIEGEQAALLALLSDGTAWSTSALALALGASQRTVQRALVGLEGEGRVHGTGRGRARRWVGQPLIGFTTLLLLPASLPLQ